MKNKSNKSDLFRCKACDASMTFDPKEQALKCPYCGSLEQISKKYTNVQEKSFNKIKRKDTEWSNLHRVIKCENCTGEIILEKGNLSTFCPFCNSSHVIDIDKEPGIKPENIIPFSIDDEIALKNFKNWIKNKWLAPKILKKTYKTIKINGVYLPYWTYDSKTYSKYTGDAGTYYYELQSYSTTENGKKVTKTKQVRKTRWHSVKGSVNRDFDDILINGSRIIDNKIIRELEPFYLSKLVNYDSKYISGFLTERYTLDVKRSWNEAKKIAYKEIHQDVVRDINADTYRSLDIKTDYNDRTYKHILLPVWIANYNFKKKTYKFMVNGQTGEVTGKSPISVIKIILIVLFILGLIISVILAYLSKN